MGKEGAQSTRGAARARPGDGTHGARLPGQDWLTSYRTVISTEIICNQTEYQQNHMCLLSIPSLQSNQGTVS